MTDLLLVVALLLVVSASIFFTWVVVGLFRSHVPFISTSRRIARRMVELVEIKPGQKVYDLGCGRGVILFEAARSGAQCVGYELVRPVVWWANMQKHFLRLKPLQFKCADFFKEDLSDADVIFCYLWPSVMDRFYKEKWKTLKKGTKVISHGFRISALTPKKTEHVGKAPIFVYEKL